MASHLFTDRLGGSSPSPYESLNLAYHVGDNAELVADNRRKLQEKVGATVFMNQSHGDVVAVIDGIPEHEPNADAIICTARDIAIAVLTADCIPLLLWDSKDSLVAAVHVGRRGLVNGIAGKVVSIMQSAGSQKIRGLIGPAICGDCYEVGKEIFEEVTALHPAAVGANTRYEYCLDLPRALSSELEKLGVDITTSNICTKENSDYFSYRRDGVTGRNAGIIWL